MQSELSPGKGASCAIRLFPENPARGRTNAESPLRVATLCTQGDGVLTWKDQSLRCAAMRHAPMTVFRIFPACFFALGIWLLVTAASPAASLPVFAVVFGQLTNEIAMIQGSFDNSTAQKQKLATLVRARSVILDPELRDDEALAQLVTLLGNISDYDSTLDESARNARASVTGTYDLLGVRVGDLPPSPRTTSVRNRFDALASDAAALASAHNAGAISALLAPFGRKLESIHQLVERAAIMPVPRLRQNSVRAQVNGRRFVSAGDGAHSSNLFEITAPDALFLTLMCRVVDAERVITFTLPVITEMVRYEVGQGLAALSFTEDVFAPGAVAVNATEGTFFVQTDRDEIFGVFSASGPEFQITNGRFRIKLPQELRGK